MPHYVLKRLWISFISPVIWKEPSVVAMVNDLYTVNCNFLQLLIKWLRLLCQISTVLTVINIPQQKKSFEYKGFLSLFNIQSYHSILAGGVRGGGWKGYETGLFFILLHPPSSRAAYVGHWTKNDGIYAKTRWLSTSPVCGTYLPVSCTDHQIAQIKLNF